MLQLSGMETRIVSENSVGREERQARLAKLPRKLHHVARLELERSRIPMHVALFTLTIF